jgi:N-acetyl-gamma-glutamyl-phosphate reductase
MIKEKDMIKAGIIGGAGYTAGELLRLLINHPEVEITFVNSSSNAGNPIVDVHEGLVGETDIVFTDQLPLEQIDVLFFCTAHGDTRKFMESHVLPEGLKVVDLSMDYRIEGPEHQFVYGLPELNKERIKAAEYIANPGCFATCIQLALLPLAKNQMIHENVMVNAITGSTGAGVKPGATSHFSWRNNNMSIYKPFAHQHVPEIKQSLRQLQCSFNSDIDFIPYRGDFARGIFATIVLHSKVSEENIIRMFTEFYADAPFVHVTEKNLDLKQVVNTNKCLIHIEKHEDKLLIISCVDNLLKGASGQAVQNMNLLFGLDETSGLRLKPSAF